MASIGELTKLSVEEIKKIWPREDANLTPWITSNIEKLNETLKLAIEIESNEEYIHNFRLDLAGTDNYSRMPVIIELQYWKSDHAHLGKLITYSAAKEAGIMIWIANEIQEAHIDAIEWLNNITPQDMTFYGIELEVFKIDNSRPAPNFRIVAGPPPSKRRTIEDEDISPRYKKYRTFFEKLIDKALSLDSNFTRAKAHALSWWATGIGRIGYSLSVYFSQTGELRIEITIELGKREHNVLALEQLMENKTKIEENIGFELIWDPSATIRACRIYKAQEATIDDNDDKLEEIIEWAAPVMIKMKEVFKPFVRNIQVGN